MIFNQTRYKCSPVWAIVPRTRTMPPAQRSRFKVKGNYSLYVYVYRESVWSCLGYNFVTCHWNLNNLMHMNTITWCVIYKNHASNSKGQGHSSGSKVIIFTHIIQVLVRCLTLSSIDGLSTNLVQVFTSMSQCHIQEPRLQLKGQGHSLRSKVTISYMPIVKVCGRVRAISFQQ